MSELRIKGLISRDESELQSTFGYGCSLSRVAVAVDTRDEDAIICAGCGESICECPTERDRQCRCGNQIPPGRADHLAFYLCDSCLEDHA